MFTEMRVLHESNDDDHLVCSPCCRLMRFCSCSAVALGYILWISDIPIYIYIYQCQVFELGMNFLTADDMSALMAVKLRKRLGFGMWAKLHLLGMHIEGKVGHLNSSYEVFPAISHLTTYIWSI